MGVNGLAPNVQKQRVDGGQVDQSLGQIVAPLDNVLSLLNAAFGGTVAGPLLDSARIAAFSTLPFVGGAKVYVANGFLTFQNAQGNVIRLGSGGTTTVVGGGTTYAVFGASGTGHSTGLVPDPGSTVGTARFLREDATWATPPSGTTYSVFGASGSSHSTGLVPDPGSVTGTVKYLREDSTWAVPPNATYSVFGASGSGHTTGLVPDPGSTAGATRYLREDSTWVTPPTGTTYSVFGASGSSHASGLVPDPGSTAGTTKFLREDSTWAVPSGGSSGLGVGQEGVLNSGSSAQTWTASGQTYTWTVPSTINGNSFTSVVITKVAVTLLSGSPGTSALFGVKINGTTVAGVSRQLPPYGGGVNVSITDLNVQSLSGTSVNPAAGQTVVITTGGTFSGSSTWRVDIIGYYV